MNTLSLSLIKEVVLYWSNILIQSNESLVQLGDDNRVSDFFSSFILISAFRNKQ